MKGITQRMEEQADLSTPTGCSQFVGKALTAMVEDEGAQWPETVVKAITCRPEDDFEVVKTRQNLAAALTAAERVVEAMANHTTKGTIGLPEGLLEGKLVGLLEEAGSHMAKLSSKKAL